MNRRRSFRDDGGRGGRSFKRRRYDSEMEPDESSLSLEEQIEGLLVRIGEKNSKPLEENLKSIADVIIKSTEKSKMVQLVCECSCLLPENGCIYSTLVGILNAKNFKLGGEIVEKLFNDFKEYLKNCEWKKASILIRFFADLVNCNVISSGSLMNFFESLVDVTMEDNIPQVRADFYVFSVLSALPLVGKELSEKKEQDLDQLLNTIDNYITKRNKTHHTALRVWYSDTPHPQEEYLECLWTQIFKLRSDKWIEKEILKPYLKLDSLLCEALQHNLPQFQPPPHENSNIYPYPRVVFRLFDYTDCPDDYVLPGAHSIERFLIEENLRWIIDNHYFMRKECALMLLNFSCEKRIPIEYIIVEVILGELFTVPTSKHLEICYGSLLLELCKLQPKTLPQVLAQAVELLMERLDTMNTACIDRFASWFAYHLSNFEFTWSWDDSSSCLSMDHLHPKQKFIRETLSRCVRLSYHEKIAETLPEPFHVLLPEQFIPVNKYTEDETGSVTGSTFAVNLLKALKEKCKDGALDVLKDVPNPLQGADEEPNHNPLKINIFVTQLLNVYSKSFTHLFAGIAMYNTCLQQLSTSEEAQICILKALFEVWSSHQQLLVILTEKLLKAQIISHAAVINWLFSKEMSGELTKSYIWEILHSAVNTLTIAVEKYQRELNELKEKLRSSDNGEEAPESSAVTDEMIEDIEEKLEAAQSNQKHIFLIIFQRFIMLLSEHIRKSESQGKSFKTYWFRWCIGRLQQVFFEHHKYVFKYVSTLESLLFTADLDQHILTIFRQFCSLRA